MFSPFNALIIRTCTLYKRTSCIIKLFLVKKEPYVNYIMKSLLTSRLRIRLDHIPNVIKILSKFYDDFRIYREKYLNNTNLNIMVSLPIISFIIDM